jgi:hypothetical protein
VAPCIRVRFITNDDFISRAICFVTNSLFCHVEFGTPDGTWVGAHDDGGVQERPANYCQPTREYVYEIPCTQQQQDDALAWMRSQIGAKYNFLDILGLLLHNRKLTTPRQVICSQFVSRGLLRFFGAARYLNVLAGATYLVTPETAHLSPIFVGCLVRKVEPAAGG